MTEFDVLVDQIRRRKEAFIARLERNLITIQRHMPEPCRLWTGPVAKYYGRISFRIPGKRRRHEHKNHRCFDVQ